MSDGTRSGVNWIGANYPPTTVAKLRTASVLATPGTPSSRMCPLASRPTISCSTMCSCPTMIRWTWAIASPSSWAACWLPSWPAWGGAAWLVAPYAGLLTCPPRWRSSVPFASLLCSMVSSQARSHTLLIARAPPGICGVTGRGETPGLATPHILADSGDQGIWVPQGHSQVPSPNRSRHRPPLDSVCPAPCGWPAPWPGAGRWRLMSTPEPPGGPADQPWTPGGGPGAPGLPPYVPVSPLLPDDPPRVGGYWLDARLSATPAGVAFTAHDEQNTPVMLLLLSEGAAADAAARARFAGEINSLHIDTVVARGGEGQDTGRLGRKFRSDENDPAAPDQRPSAPWAALAYDGSPAAANEAARILDSVQLATLPPQGTPSGPEYQQYWVQRVRPGLARLWPLPWPGRFDRAGWRTILVSWLLMMLLAALAVLIAILIFRNQPPQSPPPPTGGSGSPPPQSGSPPPQSGSPSPQSGSPSPGSGSPSPESGSPSGSPSPSQSGTASASASPSPSGTE